MPRSVFAAVDLWFACRAPAGMGGAPFPCAGGMVDQPAALIDAFALLDGWAGQKGA